jgi:hypothetical protein
VKTNFNNFLVFVFSLIPGAGYMYLGLMQKGLEAMLLFFVSVTVFIWLNLPQLIPMIAIPLWFYFFFDTFAQRGRLVQGEEIDDQGVLNLMARLGEQRYYYLGIALLAIGTLALLGNLSQDLFNWWVYGHYFRKYLLSVLLIAGGLFLLFRARSPKPNSDLNARESETLSSEMDAED